LAQLSGQRLKDGTDELVTTIVQMLNPTESIN